MDRKALIVLFPGCIELEVVMVAEILAREFTVESATPDGADLVGSSGMIIRPQRSYIEADCDEYDCVVIPGGDLGSILDNQDLDRLLVRAHERGAVLAAICAGPLALAKAGVLRGYAYTQAGLYPESMAHIWDGAEHREQQVVVDRDIITALPEAFIDFAVAVARKMGVYDDAEAERRRRYFRGVHARDWSAIGAVKGI